MSYNLHIENFLTIEEMDLDLSPGIQGFVGDNAQGKTNILNALSAILDGSHDPRLIKDGAKRCEIRLEEIDENDDIVRSVSRIRTDKSNRLTSKNLPTSLSPKIYLSRLLDEIALNPIKLISEDPVKYLKKHLPMKVEASDLPRNMSDQVPFDLNENALDECEKQKQYYGSIRLKTYQEMRHQKEVVDELKRELPPLPEADLPYSREGVDAEERKLIEESATIDIYNKNRQEVIASAEVIKESVSRIGEKIDQFEIAIEDHKESIEIQKHALEERIKKLRAEHAEWERETRHKIDLNREKIEGFEEQKDEKERELSDVLKRIESNPERSTDQIEERQAEIKSKKRKLDEIDSLKRRHSQVFDHEKVYNSLKDRHSEEDELYKYFSYELPKILISRCDLHVDGLGFREDELYVNDRHIDRLSSAERAIVAVKLVVELAKRRGHIAVCLDGIENMDQRHREDFLDAMKDSGLKVLYTRYGRPEYSHETLVQKEAELSN